MQEVPGMNTRTTAPPLTPLTMHTLHNSVSQLFNTKPQLFSADTQNTSFT